MKDNSRYPSARKSTGHDTGILIARTVSWPPNQAMRVARILRKRRRDAELEQRKAITGNEQKRRERLNRVALAKARHEQERAAPAVAPSKGGLFSRIGAFLKTPVKLFNRNK